MVTGGSLATTHASYPSFPDAPWLFVVSTLGAYSTATHTEFERQTSSVNGDCGLALEVNDTGSTPLFVDNITDEGTITHMVCGGQRLPSNFAPPNVRGLREL